MHSLQTKYSELLTVYCVHVYTQGEVEHNKHKHKHNVYVSSLHSSLREESDVGVFISQSVFLLVGYRLTVPLQERLTSVRRPSPYSYALQLPVISSSHCLFQTCMIVLFFYYYLPQCITLFVGNVFTPSHILGIIPLVKPKITPFK